MQVGRQIKLCLIVQIVFTLVVFDPVMVDHLLDRGSSVRVFVEGALDKVDSIFRYISQQAVVRFILRNIIIHPLLGWIRISAIVEGRCARQQNVRNDTCCPAINLIVVRLLFDQLRSHIHGAAEGEGLLVIRVIFRRKSKICQLHINLIVVDVISVLLAQKILRLEISVHDVLLVHEVEGEKNLLDHVSSLRFSKFA